MANRKVNINIVTTANTTGAQQAAQAMENLATSSNKATTAATGVGKGASRAGQLAGQAGYQIQDFAIQVGAGTSALTAFAQQAPQLLGAFGPAGAIAGAVVAIGAIATKVFLSMGSDAMSAEEKAKKLAETIKKIGEAAEKSVKDDIDFGRQKIEDSTAAAQQFADELNAMAQNQIDLTDAIAKSLKGINEAEMELEELRGESNDKLKVQAEQAAADAARRQEEASKRRADELQRIKIANDALTISKADLVEREAQKAEAYATLAVDYQLLKVAREKLETAKEIKKAQTFAALMGESSTTPEQRTAIEGLESGALAGDVERLKQTVIAMQESVDKTGELTKAVQEAQRKATAVEGDLRLTTLDVENNLKEIDADVSQIDVTATTEALKDRATLLAEEVKSITEDVVTTTDSEKAALEVIKSKLSDNKIDLAEMTATTAALAELAPRIREVIGDNGKKINQLITIMAEMKVQAAAIQTNIDNLQRQKGFNTGKTN